MINHAKIIAKKPYMMRTIPFKIGEGDENGIFETASYNKMVGTLPHKNELHFRDPPHTKNVFFSAIHFEF